MLSLPVGMWGYAMFGLAVLLGPTALALFALFLFFGSLDLINLTMDETEKLLADAGLSLMFFAQHSTMIRRSFRKRLVRLLPEAYSGAFYTIASSLVLVLLVIFWQQSAHSLATAHNVVRWFLRALYFLSILGFFWGVKALGFFDPFGLKAAFAHLRGLRLAPRALIVRGPYRYVRHPLYLFVLLMIWSCPDLTADRMLFNVLCTAWIIVGSVLEERDLVAFYGDTYRNYQSEVPMLIPRPNWARRYE